MAGWKQLFPAKWKTELESLTFTKKLMTATLSNILFVRNIFGDDSFAKKSLNGIPLRILKEKSSDPRANSFANWLVGAFDALKKKYLRTMTLVIFLDPAFPENSHEAYTIKVSYPGGVPSCEVVGALGQVQNSTRDLLQAILVMTDGLDPLPETAYLALRLSYYEENTPGDYEPNGYQSAEKELVLPVFASKMRIGRVSTAHHGLSFNVHAKPAGSSQEDQLVNDQFAQSQPSQSQLAQENVEDPQLADMRPSRSFVEELEHISEERENDEMLGQATNELEITKPPRTAITSCTCGIDQRDDQMLLCQYCGHEQHLSCYKLLPNDLLPSAHCCLPCSLQGEGKVCTDARLTRIFTKRGLRVVANTMVFRRVLAALISCNTASEDLLEGLGLAKGLVKSVVEKLKENRILQQSGYINRSALEETLQKFFEKRARKRSRDEEEVETMVRAAHELHIGEMNEVEVAGANGDKRGEDFGGRNGEEGVKVDVEEELQHDGGGDDGLQQRKERKRRRVSRTRGE